MISFLGVTPQVVCLSLVGVYRWTSKVSHITRKKMRNLNMDYKNHVLELVLISYCIIRGRSGGGVVDNTLDYQSRGRKIDPPLLRSFG